MTAFVHYVVSVIHATLFIIIVVVTIVLILFLLLIGVSTINERGVIRITVKITAAYNIFLGTGILFDIPANIST